MDFDPAHHPPLADKKKIKPKHENEPVKILPQSPPPRSILALGATTGAGRKGKTPKHVLSCKLHIYYSRLTTNLRPPTNEQAKRAAALSPLQYDAGLENLLRTWCAGSARGHHQHSEFEYRCGLRDQLGGSVEGFSCTQSDERLSVESYVRPFRSSLPPVYRNGEDHYTITDDWVIGVASPNSPTLPLDPFYLFATFKPANTTRKRSRDPPRPPPAARGDVPLALGASHQNALTISFEPGKDRGTREGAVRGLSSLGRSATCCILTL